MASNKPPDVTVIASPPKEGTEPWWQQQMDCFWEAIERIGEHNADMDPAEVYRIVTEVVNEVRQEHFARA